ncbi:hypothetical protein ACNRWW_02985 [Metabacillus sp. HB246100]
MHQYFIATESFDHIVDCFCPDSRHEDTLKIYENSLIEITEDRKFIMDRWYILIVLNTSWQFYMALEDVENYFKEGKMMTSMDLELKLNYVTYKLDEALAKRDEAAFVHHSKTQKKLCHLKERLHAYLDRASENHLM